MAARFFVVLVILPFQRKLLELAVPGSYINQGLLSSTINQQT